MTQGQTISTRIVPVHSLARDLEIECQFISEEKTSADLMVFLHEGLGSVGLWKDWPAQLCDAANCRGLVFSRYGYGASTLRPKTEKWPANYMHEQAREFLPALFNALGMASEKPIILGHSDGGSIALIYAGMYPDKVKAVISMASHIMVEDVTIESIQKAREAFLNTDLPKKMARYHKDSDSAFWGWNDAWLSPEFRAWNIEPFVAAIRCPILAIQGREDEYSTLAQIQGIKRIATQSKLCIMDDCHHSPHKEKPQVTIDAVVSFLKNL